MGPGGGTGRQSASKDAMDSFLEREQDRALFELPLRPRPRRSPESPLHRGFLLLFGSFHAKSANARGRLRLVELFEESVLTCLPRIGDVFGGLVEWTDRRV